MAVKHGPCLLTPKRGSKLLKNKVPEETFPHYLLGEQDQRLGEINFYVGWVHRSSSGKCQETETCMVWACHMPRKPLQNHPSGHFGGWVMPWSTEEMLDEQHERMDIAAHARTAHKNCKKDQKRIYAELFLMSFRRPN